MTRSSPNVEKKVQPYCIDCIVGQCHGVLETYKEVYVTCVPFLTALVLHAATSDPPPGSLTAMLVTMSPAMAGTRYVSFSFSLPKLTRAGVEQSVWTPSAIATPELNECSENYETTERTETF